MTVNGSTQNPTSINGGGQATESALVRIDSDIRPVWETEALPDWVVTWLIPMLSAGQKWPEASESGLSDLAQKYAALAAAAVGATPDAGAAARTVVTGWSSPATAEFVSRAKVLYGHEGGLAGVSANAHAYGQQANDFAVETQYSKISINVAFWVTVVAIAIALIAAFFSAGTSTAIIGPYAAAARAAISRILVRLATLGGRSLTATRLARVTTLSGATGRGAIARLLASPLGRELIEEIGEEFFIDAASQYQQIRMGTRQEWDWKKSQAAIVGAGAGAVIGTRLAGPVSQVTSAVPGFAGRALTTGATNMIASPVGSFVANGAVYGQWQNPFTADALMGGFLGGAGRTGTISPFNPDVYSALASPVSTLASAYDAAARTDAMRASGDPGQGAGGNPTSGGPTGGPDGGPVRTGDAARTGSPSAHGSSTRASGSATAPDADPTRRRTPPTPEPGDQADGRPGRSSRTAPDPATREPSADPERNRTESSRTNEPAQRQDPAAAQSPQTTSAPQSNTTPAAQNENTPTSENADPAPHNSGTADSSPQNSNPTDPAPQTDQRGQTASTAEQPAPGDVRADAEPTARADATPDPAAPATPQNPEHRTETADSATATSQAAAPASATTHGQPSAPAPAATPGQPSGPETAVVYTSRPGTVTSRPVPGTRYVTDGRQGPDLTVDEVRAATDELLASYFLDGTVTDWTWSQDGSTLLVRTTDGTRHFRPVIGGVNPDLMAETLLNEKKGTEKGGTAENPYVVRFNPRVASDQLARVWLHEITDALQAAQPDHGRGVLRRRRAERTQDHCVTAKLNELAMLADKWDQAQSMPEKRLIAVDLDGLARELNARGQSASEPPWAASQAVRQPHAPPLPGPRPSQSEIQAIVDALIRSEQHIVQQIEAKKESARQAHKEAAKARKKARRAKAKHDQGRFERARKARREQQNHFAARARYLRIAEAYGPALKQAQETREAYERVLYAMRQSGLPTQPGAVSMTDVAGWLTTQAAEQHREYLKALEAALPRIDALPTVMPTDGLAHRSALTTAVNEMLERNGAEFRYTSDGLERALRADFHKVVSPDGVVLRVGHGDTAAELRFRLTLSDLAEVLDPGVTASEMMVGHFFQAARTISATEASSGGMSGGFDTRVLAKAMPEGEWYRTVTEILGVSVGVSSGRQRSATGGAGMYAQGGSVADNRSESLMFDAAASWTVEIRTGEPEGWRDTTVVNSGAPGDPGGQRIWVSHSYTDQPPRKLTWISDQQRDSRLPNHVVHHMSHLGDTFDTIAARLGGDYAKVGTVARQQLHAFIADELPHRLRDAQNGLERVFMKDGRPHARVRAETKVVLVLSEPLGGATAEQWEEEVLVDFVAAPGGTSSGGSLEAKASVGIKHPVLEDVNGPFDYSPDIGPSLTGSRSAARTYSATAGMQAIHPSVHRKTSPMQAYRLALETTFVVEEFGKPPVTLPTVFGRATVSMRESAAYRFGLPVGSDALVYRDGQPVVDADGNQVLRGDPRPEPIPGRKPELPEWLGEGPNRMRGAGPALVQDIEGLDQFRAQVLEQLAKRGLIPEMVNGEPQYARSKLARATQILNLQEVTEQLSEHRIRSAYDSLAQDGILLDLVRHRVNSAPEHFVMRISLEQSLGRSDYLGHTETETVVNLDIGSDTAARAISRSRTYAGDGSASLSDGPAEGQEGFSHGVKSGGGGRHTRTVGSSAGGTVNVVTLQENGGHTAIFSVPHRLKAEMLSDGAPTLLATGPGSARLLFSADLLPPSDATPPAPLGEVSDRLRSRLKLLHMDVPYVLMAARQVLPQGMREDSVAFQKIASVLNVRNLVSHAKLLTRPIVTNLAVRAQGVPVRSSLSVSGKIRDASVVGVVDQVNGDILFGLGSAGVSWGGSTGTSVGGSRTFGDVDVDEDNGTTSDSGTISGPASSRGTSESTSILDIWGREELTIEFGRQYIVRAAVDLTLTGSESVAEGTPTEDRIPIGREKTDNAKGSALFSLPEHDALLMYGDGELDLPGTLVRDAIERMLNGSLTLDQSVAVPLVQQYVKDVAEARAAGEDVSYADAHTPERLSAKLMELTGLRKAKGTSPHATAEERFGRTLSRANEALERAKDVVLGPAFESSVGVGATESLTLTDADGGRVEILDAVLGALRDAAPGALDGSPNVAEEVRVDFSSDAARIHVNDMWSRNGYEKSYHVQSGPHVAQAEEVTVKVRLEYDDDGDSRKAEFLSRTHEAGVINQLYSYLDGSHAESWNGSYSAGLDYGDGNNGDGQGVGLSTDRGRGYSASTNQQATRLQRQGLFLGLDRVRQDMKLVIEVTRRPVHPGAVRRTLTDGPRRGPRTSPPVTYRASLVRRIPTGMTRPAHEDPGQVGMVSDPRQAELRPGFYTETLREDPNGPTLFEVVHDQLTKMIGRNAVEERRYELAKRLSLSASQTAFEQRTGPVGQVLRVSRLGFKNQGVKVTIRARLSDLTIVAGPFDGEKGEVDRKADGQNVTVSRSRVRPLGVSAGWDDAGSGLSGGVRAREQSAESVTDHHAARRERSEFTDGDPLYTVRLRVDYDVIFEFVALLRGRDESVVGDPVLRPGAAQGTVDVTLSARELQELTDRMERDVRLAPPVDPGSRVDDISPAPGRESLAEAVWDARLEARERGRPVRVEVQEGDVVHRYVAAPDGSVHSEEPDGGFAEALASLSPAALDAAVQAGLDLRHVFMNSTVTGTFTQQVLAELGVEELSQGEPAWPAARAESQTGVGGTTAQGFAGGGSPSPALEGTIFDRAGRPGGDPDLTLAEVRGLELLAGDLGEAVHVSWTSGDLLTVQSPAAPDQHVRVLIEDPGAGLNGTTEARAGTPEDPHLVRLWQRIHPDVVSSVLVHELSHVMQEAAAVEAGAPQGVIRESSSPREGDDLCLVPRQNEHAHLARKWLAATAPDVRETLADAIDAIAADLERRGHPPPPPPWGTGSRTAVPVSLNRIDALLNDGATAVASSRPQPLPEAAATAAVERTAALMGARAEPRGPGVLDIVLPGRPPIPVHVRPPVATAPGHTSVPEQRRTPGQGDTPGQHDTPGQRDALGQGGTPGQGDTPGQHDTLGQRDTPGQGDAPERGALTFHVDGRLTIGANERAAAAAAAGAIARARGEAAADQAALAELHEAVRQVRAATEAQRAGRLGVLYDLVTSARPEVLRLLPEPVAAELAVLADGPRPVDRAALLRRLRTLANTTGWYPPEEPCRCPEGAPCVCGHAAAPDGPQEAETTSAAPNGPREATGAVRA